MDNEQYKADYTAEEQQADRWQGAPPVLHMAYAGPGRLQDVSREREPEVSQRLGSYDIRYVRSDLYDAQAARVVELEQLLAGCTVDLAKLDASRGGAA